MPAKKLGMLAAAASLALILVACDKGQTGKGAGGVGAGSKAIAEINGTKLTEDDVKTEAEGLPPAALKALSDDKTRQKFLDNLISKRLIVQEAEKKCLDKEGEVARKLNQLRDTVLVRAFVQTEVFDKVKVSDQDVKAYFDQNKDSLGSVRLGHILVGSQAEADDIMAKLKAGESFDKLAKAHSMDAATRDKGGDIGFVKWAQLNSASLKDAAFKLKPGGGSAIVQSSAGYHVIHVTDKKPAADAEFASMKDALKESLTEKKKEELFDAVVKALRDKAKVTTDSEALKAVSFSASASPAGMPGMEGSAVAPEGASAPDAAK